MNKAYAETTEDKKVPFDLIKGIGEGQGVLTVIPETVSTITDMFDKVIKWFSNLPHNIAEMSVNLMSSLYELSSTLILKTPLWIFNNEWFENTTYQFSLLCIGLVSVLTAIEGVKQMLPKMRGKRTTSTPMDIKDIGKRWFLVSGIITAVPYLFQKAFQGLNFVSDKLIAMGVSTMDTVALPEEIKMFDVITLIIFNIILIGTIIPVLWKNGRRFFDIMILGVVSPFALTAWIFNSYKHWFRQWWEQLKHLALVQVYYALFLLVLGWFIFGVPTPDDFIGVCIKILVVIGGFARMVNPPRLISKYLDNKGGMDDLFSGAKTAKDKTKHNFSQVKSAFTKTKKPLSTLMSISNPSPKVVTGNTRMARNHNK